ncbi:cytochrome P450 [Artemisia annua]|uniref:Cytochrome P450 n=1 Tax=Artemisia annua TaxID=35608 RepID=A0A2U1KQN7_ARTAN|nr:cytochrome P450 [Artemisia annua]
MDLLVLVLSSITFLFSPINHGIDLHRKRKMSPGPTGLPIIGNLLDLGPKPHESLAKLSKKHGPLMTIRLGSITSVIASTPDAAREILQHAVIALDNHDVAVLWIPTNDEWRTTRKAINTCLTNQHKLDSLRNLREKDVHGMLEFLRESMRKQESVDIEKLAFAVALNQLSNTCLSQNVTTYESDDIKGFQTAVKTLMEVDGKFNIADIFPILKPLDPQNIRRQAKAAYDWFDKVTEGFISERLKHRESKLPRFGDMLDSLLDYSQDKEADFNLVHIKTLLVSSRRKLERKLVFDSDIPQQKIVVLKPNAPNGNCGDEILHMSRNVSLSESDMITMNFRITFDQNDCLTHLLSNMSKPSLFMEAKNRMLESWHTTRTKEHVEKDDREVGLVDIKNVFASPAGLGTCRNVLLPSFNNKNHKVKFYHEDDTDEKVVVYSEPRNDIASKKLRYNKRCGSSKPNDTVNNDFDAISFLGSLYTTTFSA